MYDEVLFLPDNLVAEGRAAGRKDGMDRGFQDGKAMGTAKGFEIAAEMGFCKGCCLAWLRMHDENPDRFPFSEKAVASMRAVVSLADSVPRVNKKDAIAVQTAQRVRARFRAVTSMLGMPVAFDSRKQTEAKDYSF